MPIITHSEIASFSDERVNLKRDKVKEEREQVGRLRDKIATFVREHPEVGLRKMLLSGSLAKGTALSTLNDIDVALYVEADKAPSIYDNRHELLEWIADKLRKAYPQMAADQIKPQTHTVRISFRGTGVDVEVAPVWYDEALDKQKQDKGHLINRHTGKPVLTSIPMHLAFTRARKAKQPDHFAQVIRLVKWWAREQKAADSSGAFRCRSFLVELICAHLSDVGTDFSDYPDALAAVFAYLVRSGLEDRVSFTDYYAQSDLPKSKDGVIEVFDPVNATNNVVGDYTSADLGRLLEAAEVAVSAIAEAERAVTKGRAVECWQRVLGPAFKG